MSVVSSTLAPFTLYGIRNCSQVKKARCWLEEKHIFYTFHDYRTDGLNAEQLQQFIDNLGWRALLNTGGTTWRKLDETVKKSIDNQTAASMLMLQQPAIIKRPLLVTPEGQYLLGFSEKYYQQLRVSSESEI